MTNAVDKHTLMSRASLWVPALLLIPSVIYLIHLTINHQVWAWDPSAYGIASIELWNALTRHASSWPSAAFDAIWSSRPPLIAWLGEFFVPIGQLLHSIDLGLLLLIMLTQYANLTFAYNIGKELSSNRTIVALCVCLAVSGAPLFVWLNTQYIVEPFQLFGTMYIYWIAAKGPSLKPLRAIGHLMIALSIVLLSKSSSVLYCAAPVLLVLVISLYSLWLNIRQKRTRLLVLDVVYTIAAAICFSIAIAWYIHNFTGMYAVLRDASFGAAALNYGHRDSFISKLWIWMAKAGSCFFRPWFLLALLSCISIQAFRGLFYYKHSQQALFIKWSYRRILAVTALLELALIFSTMALNIGEDSRYIVASLPSIIVLLSLYLSRYTSKVMSLTFLSIFVLQFFASGVSELSRLKEKEMQAFNDALTLGNTQTANTQITPGTQKVIDIEITRLVRFLASNKQGCSAVVGVSYSWLNSNTLNFYSLKQVGRPLIPCQFIGLPVLSSSQLDSALNIIDWAKPQFFISVKSSMQPKPADFTNQLSLPLWKIAIGPKNFKRVPFSSQLGIAVFRVNE